MRDQTHDEFILRWAKFVRDHPTEWKKKQKEFIDSQFQKSMAFILRLSKTPDGKRKIMKAYGIVNRKGYPSLLSE